MNNIQSEIIKVPMALFVFNTFVKNKIWDCLLLIDRFKSNELLRLMQILLLWWIRYKDIKLFASFRSYLSTCSALRETKWTSPLVDICWRNWLANKSVLSWDAKYWSTLNELSWLCADQFEPSTSIPRAFHVPGVGEFELYLDSGEK